MRSRIRIGGADTCQDPPATQKQVAQSQQLDDYNNN